MTPLERADKARVVLSWVGEGAPERFRYMDATLLPPGSMIFRDEAEILAYLREKGFVSLTPDEAAEVRADFRAALAMGEHGLPARALALLARGTTMADLTPLERDEARDRAGRRWMENGDLKGRVAELVAELAAVKERNKWFEIHADVSADEIAGLGAELEQARKERDEALEQERYWRIEACYADYYQREAESKSEEAEAALGAARDALEWIANRYRDDSEDVRQIARDALAGKGQT